MYLDSWCHINSQVCWSHLYNFLLLCFHNVWQSCITGLIQSQVSRKNCRKINADCLQSSINLTHNLKTSISLLNF